MKHLLKAVFRHYFSSNTFQKGAALGYYAVFSLLPMIVIIVSFLGLFFGEEAVSGEVYQQLKAFLGSNAAQQIQAIIQNQHTKHNNSLTTLIGFVTLGLSASGMFGQIHNSFNAIWDIKAKPRNSAFHYLTKHLISFFILIASFFILLVSTLLSSFLLKHADSLPPEYRFLYLYEQLISYVVLLFVFGLMFRFLGDARIHWKSTVAGGTITALLFIFGKIGIGIYIGHSPISSTFGSASVLAILMLWVYYTSQILFLGASFVKVISDRLGSPILPNKNAVKVKNIEIP